MSDLENVDLIVASKDESFGGILKLEREKKGLSIDDVCDDLHLDKKVIYALENHNLEDLPEPAFVCGYIRNYARFLKLQPEPIVEDFKKEVNLSADISSINTVGDISYSHQEKRSHFLIFFLLILVALGGYFGWDFWKNNAVLDGYIGADDITDRQSETANGNDDFASVFSLGSNDDAAAAELSEQNMAAAAEQSEKARTDKTESNRNQTTEFAIRQEALDEQTRRTERTVAGEQVVGEKTQLAENQEKLDNQIPPERTARKQAEESTAAKPTEVAQASELEKQANQQSNHLIEKQKKVSNQKSIKFSFSKDSWISVKDANNKSLVYDLMRAGEELELKGVVPIRVFLGDATGVSLVVEEEAFDLSGFINRKNIAKFNVN